MISQSPDLRVISVTSELEMVAAPLPTTGHSPARQALDALWTFLSAFLEKVFYFFNRSITAAGACILAHSRHPCRPFYDRLVVISANGPDRVPMGRAEGGNVGEDVERTGLRAFRDEIADEQERVTGRVERKVVQQTPVCGEWWVKQDKASGAVHSDTLPPVLSPCALDSVETYRNSS